MREEENISMTSKIRFYLSYQKNIYIINKRYQNQFYIKNTVFMI